MSLRRLTGLPAISVSIVGLVGACTGSPTQAPSLGPGPTATQSAAASAEPTAGATVAPASPLIAGEWEAIPEVSALDGAFIYQVSPGPGALMAVGRIDVVGAVDPEPATWQSTDGRTWTRVVDSLLTAPGAVLESVTAYRSGFVIVGGDSVWTTIDGQVWARSSLGKGSHARSVASHGSSLVVVGSVDYGTTTPPQQKPAIWTSADGRAWSRSTVVGSGAAFGRFLHVIDGTAGFVSIGVVSQAPECDVCPPTPEHRLDGVPWFSTDGRSWQRVTDPEPFAGAWINGIVPGGPGLVAVGQRWATDTAGIAVVWTSVDGRSWTEVRPPPFGGAFVDLGVGGAGSQLVAFDRSQHDATNPSRWWSSSDGAAWQAVPDPPLVDEPGVFTAAIVHFKAGLVAVGSRQVPSTPDACPGTKLSPPGGCRTVGTLWVSPPGSH